MGTVEEERLADLIVVDGDPSTDIDILQEPSDVNVVMKDGCVQIADGRLNW